MEFLYVDMNVTYTTSNEKETYQNEWYSKNISFSAHMKREISWPRLKYFLLKNGQCVTKMLSDYNPRHFDRVYRSRYFGRVCGLSIYVLGIFLMANTFLHAAMITYDAQFLC